MLLDILIPTLRYRRESFERLVGKLESQIHAGGWDGQVEVLRMLDDGEQSLGSKRNGLIGIASGEFVAFVDDDDDVSDDYVERICRALTDHPGVDCLGLNGIVYFRGTHPHPFVHSLQYDHYFSRRGVYYRPPYILNPVRRSIAAQFRFENVGFNEDIDWALQLVRSRALRSEFMLDSTLYYYYSRRDWRIQWMIDATEPLRHPLGLQLSNRLRFTRWLRERRKP